MPIFHDATTYTTSKSTTLYTTAIIDVQGKKAIGSFNEKGSHKQLR